MRRNSNVYSVIKYGVFIMYQCSMGEEHRRLEIEIEYDGQAILDSRWHADSECSPFSRLYYIKNGNGWLKCGNDVINMTAGNVYLIPAECRFSYGCTALEKMFFHISVITAEQYDLLSGLKKIYCAPFLPEDYKQLERCYFSKNYTDFLGLKTVIYKTVLQFAEDALLKNGDIRRYSELVEKSMRYIQNNPRINLTAKELAGKMFVSESKLRNAFRAETGMTLGKYIDGIVFRRAKMLLAKKKLSMEEISRELGFCDRFYFSRRFKQRVGKTPSDYRNECGTIE